MTVFSQDMFLDKFPRREQLVAFFTTEFPFLFDLDVRLTQAIQHPTKTGEFETIETREREGGETHSSFSSAPKSLKSSFS